MKHQYHSNVHIFSEGEPELECLDITGHGLAISKASASELKTEQFISHLQADVIVLPLATYREHFYHPAIGDAGSMQAYIILVGPHEVEAFSGLQLRERCYPVFLPVSKMQLQALVQSLSGRQPAVAEKNGNQRYRMLFRRGPFIQLLINIPSGIISECNDAAAHFYQRSSRELEGCCFFDLHPDVRASLQEMIFSCKEDGSDRFVMKISWNDQVKDLEFFSERVIVNNESLVYLCIQDISESLQAAELLHQQHEMLRSTLSSIDDLFFTMNNHGEFIEYYQPGSNHQLSLSSDLFVGKSITEVGFPQEVARKYLQAIDKVLETGRNEQLEYYLDAFGTRLWYHAKITPRRNSLNVAEGVTVLCRDVTRQKKTEETLTRARDFYLTLFNDFPSMIWRTNASKKADYFNKTWLEFTGRTLEEEIQTGWMEKIHYDDTPRFLSVLSEAYHQKKPFQLEHRLRHQDGSYRWVIDVGRPFHNLDGQFAGFIGSIYDITERRNTEDMLRIQRSALENALEGMLIIEAQKEGNPVIYANKEVSKITGISQNHINGMNFLDVIAVADDPDVIGKIQEAISMKKNFIGEYCSFSPEGTQAWQTLLISPVHDRRGTVAHFVVVLADITGSKLSEKILREKNRELAKTNAELDSFVYSTSHELRSPLMSVLGLINLLEMETRSPEQQKYLDMIKESINKLDKIIHDIIDYSRNSRFEVYYEPVNFRECIHKAIQNLKYLPHAEKIAFRIDVDEKYEFYSDIRRIDILFNNFISNCIKFHNFEQENPKVHIRVKFLAGKAVITIEDNGSGIPQAQLPRIYDMFFRGSLKSNGGGIGLYIVKEIVEKLQGSIQADSVEGTYTRFVVEIPNHK